MDTQIPVKFNWLDGLILALLAAALIFVAGKIFWPEKPLDKMITLDVEVKTKHNIVPILQPGDDLYSVLYKRGRLAFGKIESVLSVQPLREANVSMEGKMVVSDNPFISTVTLRLRFLKPIEVYPDKMVYPQSSFRPDLRVGQDFRLMNFKINLAGQIIAQGFQPKK